MIIERLIDTLNDTNIYIIYDEINKNCVVIDPSNFRIVDEFININELHVDYIILTHEHFDHILGVNELINKYGCKLITSENCNDRIVDDKANLSSFSEVLLYFKSNYNNEYISDEWKNIEPYICKSADIVFKKSNSLIWNNINLYMHETPGHSKGSISIVVNNEFIFSGDSLLKSLEIITRFPGGNTKDYNNITIPYYKTLSGNMIVYPGHGESFLLKEKLYIEEN